jgi:ankyrin repeat domain-containing protein 50
VDAELTYLVRHEIPGMALILPHAGRLKPEIRLAQAVSEFEAALSKEQKAEFRTSRSTALKAPPSISDVMRITAQVDLKASRRVSGGRCFGPRLTNLLQAVQQFASLGDVIIGGSQNLVACGVWAVVRMALMVKFPFLSLSFTVAGLIRNKLKHRLLPDMSRILRSYL